MPLAPLPGWRRGRRRHWGWESGHRCRRKRRQNTVRVLVNQGGGTFPAPSLLCRGISPYGVASADVNGDGKADIVTANDDTETVSVLVSQGDGTFAAQVTYASDDVAGGVALRDLHQGIEKLRHRDRKRRQHGERADQPGGAACRTGHLCRGQPESLQHVQRSLGRRLGDLHRGWESRHCERELQKQHGERTGQPGERHVCRAGYLCRGRRSAALPWPTSPGIGRWTS